MVDLVELGIHVTVVLFMFGAALPVSPLQSEKQLQGSPMQWNRKQRGRRLTFGTEDRESCTPHRHSHPRHPCRKETQNVPRAARSSSASITP